MPRIAPACLLSTILMQKEARALCLLPSDVMQKRSDGVRHLIIIPLIFVDRPEHGSQKRRVPGGLLQFVLRPGVDLAFYQRAESISISGISV